MNNPYGFYSLIRKEVHRFTSIWTQSLLAPVLTTLLYFLIFGYTLGDRLATVRGVPYIAFLTPGLVMFAVINNGAARRARGRAHLDGGAGVRHRRAAPPALRGRLPAADRHALSDVPHHAAFLPGRGVLLDRDAGRGLRE